MDVTKQEEGIAQGRRLRFVYQLKPDALHTNHGIRLQNWATLGQERNFMWGVIVTGEKENRAVERMDHRRIPKVTEVIHGIIRADHFIPILKERGIHFI